MPIIRTSMTDDDGSGTVGTILNNAWKQELYDQIDLFRGPAVFITENVLASQINNWAPAGFGKVDAIININAAADTVITGLLAGVLGQRVMIRNLSATPGLVVSFAHAHAGSLAANQLRCIATTAPTPIGVNGTAEFVYQGTHWIMVNQTPGAWIKPAFVASDYFCTGPAVWTVTAPQVTVAAFTLHGRTVNFDLQISSSQLTGQSVALVTRKIFGGLAVARAAVGVSIGPLGVGLFATNPVLPQELQIYPTWATGWPVGVVTFRAQGSYEVI